MLRVTIYDNGSTSEGRVIPILTSMPEFLQRICEEFGCSEYNRIYNSTGAVISDTSLIRDEEIIYASKGEPFCPRVSSNDVCVEAGSNISSFHRKHSSDWVKLNVGGQLFYTSRTTLLNSDPDSMLARMFSPNSNLHPGCIDSNGAYLIDRDPRYFSPLLNYLRSGTLILDPDINAKGVLEEAYFFNIQSCIPLLEPLLTPVDEASLTRRDVINALIVTPNKDSLRFQGVNLNGADLSYLDLRNINFKYAKLRNSKLSYCNLSFCNFERADMTDVIMNCAVLSGVRLNGAIMENAKCLNCNFQDPSGQNANMEGVNLRNAVLEDSDLTGANLRVANLKGANLKATILRGAILAGADLEKSDLTGSDLHEANLRGANLKDAALELMINPLHMSQAIR
ncbi:unnamed protein product [Orchesella dallaii]|uniref:BTB/POZ domain-containing protein KCTD9 n=1 Tax=Orchesella dallaii TaxID=48710 RepID=A0ABP1QFA0_9HEXA